jgi:predicted DNA-binding antitoxin AbrB/MazE fold protein
MMGLDFFSGILSCSPAGVLLMGQLIIARFENGVLIPEQALNLSPGARVRVIVEPLDAAAQRQKAWEELERLCEEFPIDSGGERLTRDQLHERR